MEYTKFKQLIKEGERSNVDFKITCEAFSSARKRENAELVKDVCSMANNGNIASYIIIGVSDDGAIFKSVNNDQLTEEHLQDLIKANLNPIPSVRFFDRKWPKADLRHRNKRFVIIQVGPNARQAYRFSKDIVAYEEKCVFKKNEVWIRRGRICDLATPEEIAKLVKGKDPLEKSDDINIIEYAALEKPAIAETIRNDMLKYFKELNILFKHKKDLIIINLDNNRYCIKPLVLSALNTKDAFVNNYSMTREFEHFSLFITTDSVSKIAFPHHVDIIHPLPWGYYALFNATIKADNWFISNLKRSYFAAFANSLENNPCVALTLKNIKTTNNLRNSLRKTLEYLKESKSAINAINKSKYNINNLLKLFINSPDKFINTSKGGYTSKHRDIKKELLNRAKFVVDNT
ncbi:ATP-binding protein [bacterium]|nr:ATP-binding protein [bacterium]